MTTPKWAKSSAAGIYWHITGGDRQETISAIAKHTYGDRQEAGQILDKFLKRHPEAKNV